MDFRSEGLLMNGVRRWIGKKSTKQVKQRQSSTPSAQLPYYS